MNSDTTQKNNKMDINTLLKWYADNYATPEVKKAREIADFWHMIESGERQDKLIIEFREKETRAQRAQAIAVHESRTPYLVNKLKTVYRKADRSDGRIDFIKHEDDTALEDIQDRLTNFVGQHSLNYWLNREYGKYMFIDPNAFLVLNLQPYDALTEKPRPDPVIYQSHNLVSFLYEYGELKSLTVTDYKEIETIKGGHAKVKRLIHYTENEAYTVEVVEDRKEPPQAYSSATEKGYYTRYDNKQYFITIHLTRAKRVPAMQIGYMPSTSKLSIDPRYNAYSMPDHVYTVPIVAARGLFRELVRKKTTYDLHLALHGFLKTFAYVSACNYVENDTGIKCRNGRVGEHECKACKGTGKQQYHVSEQDIITLTMPGDPEEMIDLSKLIYTLKVDTELIKMHREEVEALEPKISLAVFNTNMFDRKELVTGTATEINANLSHVNNEIFAYDQQKARLWEFVVSQIANYLDVENGLTVSRKIPNDYRIESLSELLNILKAANDSGANYDTVKAIQRKILEKQNIDNLENVQIIEAREKWRPFSDLPQGERLSIITLLPDNHPKRVLYMNFSEIFAEIEDTGAGRFVLGEGETIPGPFYAMPYPKQKRVIDFFISQYAPGAVEVTTIRTASE